MVAAGLSPDQSFEDQPVKERPNDAQRPLLGKPLLDLARSHRRMSIDDAGDFLLARPERRQLAIERIDDVLRFSASLQ